jgi:hypothetical protein
MKKYIVNYYDGEDNRKSITIEAIDESYAAEAFYFEVQEDDPKAEIMSIVETLDIKEDLLVLRKDRETKTYEAYYGFFVDIVTITHDYGTEFQAWLYHKDYGYKNLMFATEGDTFGAFLGMVEDNLDSYIEDEMKRMEEE